MTCCYQENASFTNVLNYTEHLHQSFDLVTASDVSSCCQDDVAEFTSRGSSGHMLRCCQYQADRKVKGDGDDDHEEEGQQALV